MIHFCRVWACFLFFSQKADLFLGSLKKDSSLVAITVKNVVLQWRSSRHSGNNSSAFPWDSSCLFQLKRCRQQRSKRCSPPPLSAPPCWSYNGYKEEPVLCFLMPSPHLGTVWREGEEGKDISKEIACGQSTVILTLTPQAKWVGMGCLPAHAQWGDSEMCSCRWNSELA